jgi:pyridoxal phosphate enzyme (YggS family)
MSAAVQNHLRDRIHQVLGDIERAAARRGGGQVRLLAVTKTHPREAVLQAYAAGLRLFGENRVQEAEAKYGDMPADLELHCLGHLQSNKARTAVRLFSCIQSIDSLRTAALLQKRGEQENARLDILLEINTSGEASKSGYTDLDEFRRDVEALQGLSRLRLRGLMTIGPLGSDSGAIRTSFRGLKTLFDETARRVDAVCFDVLSMGMSGDYPIAIEEGANLVRIGTAIFGSRDQP